jgi:hypothetical protein
MQPAAVYRIAPSNGIDKAGWYTLIMSNDFWATEISNTPQSDKRYGGGFLLLILVAIGVVAALASYFSHH